MWPFCVTKHICRWNCHPVWGSAWLPWHASLWAGSFRVCSQQCAGDPWWQQDSACLAWGVAGGMWDWPVVGGTLWSSVPWWPLSCPGPSQHGQPHPWVQPMLCLPSVKACHATWFCHCCFHLSLPFVLSGRTKEEGEPHLTTLSSLNIPSNTAKFFLARLQWLP